MGMFLNYQNISNSYTPNNLHKAFHMETPISSLDPIDASKPYEHYDAKGVLDGYSWRYGDTIKLDFSLDGEIAVENDAIISYIKGQYPNEQCEGNVGQKFYNLADIVSYTCSGIVNGGYYWVRDTSFTYPLENGNSVYFDASTYLADKTVEVSILNFRMEPIETQTFFGTSRVVFEITKDLSRKMTKGIYYCSVAIINDHSKLVVFNSTDCKLLVQ